MVTAKEQELVDSIIRHQTYIDRFGAGLANRVMAVFDNKALMAFVVSKKNLKTRIEKLIATERKESESLIMAELTELAGYEASFMQQLALDLKDLGLKKKQIQELLQVALDKPLVVNNTTVQGLYDGAFRRKAEIATILNQSGAYGLKTTAEIYSQMLAAINQFSTGYVAATRTLSFAVSSEVREHAYSQSRVVKRVIMSATLDGRTTFFCMDIDGTIFPVGKGPRPPFHTRCRTIGIPLLDGQTDKEAAELLSYRPSIGPGENYEKGDDTSLRSHKSQIKGALVKVKIAGEKAKASSNYPNFLASQVGTAQGRQFILDRLGVRKGNRFINQIQQGKNASKLLHQLLYETNASDLDLKGFKKRLKQ